MMRSEIARFLITGSINTAASWLVYMLLNLFVPYGVAYSFAYIFGIVFTYYLNTRWVFKVPMKWSTFIQFPAVYVIRYGMDMGVMFVLISLWHCPESLAPFLALTVGMPVGFLLSRLVLKRQPPSEPAV